MFSVQCAKCDLFIHNCCSGFPFLFHVLFVQRLVYLKQPLQLSPPTFTLCILKSTSARASDLSLPQAEFIIFTNILVSNNNITYTSTQTAVMTTTQILASSTATDFPCSSTWSVTVVLLLRSAGVTTTFLGCMSGKQISCTDNLPFLFPSLNQKASATLSLTEAQN